MDDIIKMANELMKNYTFDLYIKLYESCEKWAYFLQSKQTKKQELLNFGSKMTIGFAKNNRKYKAETLHFGAS